MSILKIAVSALTLSVALSFSSNSATAQAPLSDQAVKRIVGKWVSSSGRSISFAIRDNNPMFQDELEPGVYVSGAYRQDDAGAGYVLRYTQGAECRYNMTVIGSDGNEINLRLVTSVVPEGARFRCVEGTMKRTVQN